MICGCFFHTEPVILGACHALEGRDSPFIGHVSRTPSSWILHGAWKTDLEAKESTGGPTPLSSSSQGPLPQSGPSWQ